MTSVGVLFDIEALGDGLYGYAAYKLLFVALGPQRLFGCSLSDGDVSNRYYCIAIESDDPRQIAEIRMILTNGVASGLLSPSARFVDGSRVDRLPLVRAAYISESGEMTLCTTGWLTLAWKEAAEEKQGTAVPRTSDGQENKQDNKTAAAPGITRTATLNENPALSTKTIDSPAQPSSRPAGSGEYESGQVLGGKYLIRAVYKGGMGLVYIVDSLTSLQEGKSLILALKTYQNHFLWDEEAIRRFEREATQWIDLDPHPHIVLAFLVERIEGRPYLWLEYIDGESLADRLARIRPGTAEAINLAIQFTRGIRHAYEKHGLIHRDIKPANCLITHEGVLKIADFGLSKFRAEALARVDSSPAQTPSSTQAGVRVGTPAYMPPEAIRNPSKADIRGDIYSFGVMFHEMLTGRPLFQGPDVLIQQLDICPAAPSALNPDVPRELDEIALKCLEKDPGRRFASFADLEAALEQVGRLFDGAIPKSLKSASIQPWGRQFMKAFTLMEFGKYEEAVGVFRDVLASAPAEAEAHNNLGLCLAQLGRLEEACACVKRAVELKPDYPEASSNLGGYLGQLGQFEQGIAACDRAIAIKPGWAEAHANRGANLTGLGRFDEAAVCFDRALQADPEYWKAYVMSAESLARRGERPEKVLARVEKALGIHPRDAGALAIAAACLNDLGREGDADHYLGKAETIDPNHPMVRRVKEVLLKRQREEN
jgi:serine/threonine protein kinase